MVFRASDKYVIERVKKMTEAEQTSGGDSSQKAYTEAAIVKRLKEYRLANNPEDVSPALPDFFKERGIDTIYVDIEAYQREVLIEQVKVFIERV